MRVGEILYEARTKAAQELESLYKLLDGEHDKVFKDETTIKRWLELNGVNKNDVKFYPDRSVDVNGDVDLTPKKNDLGTARTFDRCPVNFRRVTGKFDIRYRQLKSCLGLPKSCGAESSIASNHLEKLLPISCQSFDISFNPFTSLHDVHKNLPDTKHLLLYGLKKLKDSILGLLYFDKVEYNFPGSALPRPDYIKALHLIRPFLVEHNKEPFNKRLIKCQSMLLDAGLAEFAQL